MLKINNVFWLLFLLLSSFTCIYIYNVFGLPYTLLSPFIAYILLFSIHYLIVTKIIINNIFIIRNLRKDIIKLSDKKSRYQNQQNLHNNYLDQIIFLDTNINYYKVLIDQQMKMDLFIDSISLFPDGFLSPFNIKKAEF